MATATVRLAVPVLWAAMALMRHHGVAALSATPRVRLAVARTEPSPSYGVSDNGARTRQFIDIQLWRASQAAGY